jgi:CheY-like chemotaxis protein
MSNDINNLLIYLIDDDPMSNFVNTKLIHKILPNVEVVAFLRSTDALVDLRDILKVKPKMIFLDLNMPIMNGWDFMEEFKKMGLEIEIVILSSSNMLEDKLRAINNKQVKDYIVKPLSKDVLNNLFDKTSKD